MVIYASTEELDRMEAVTLATDEGGSLNAFPCYSFFRIYVIIGHLK